MRSDRKAAADTLWAATNNRLNRFDSGAQRFDTFRHWNVNATLAKRFALWKGTMAVRIEAFNLLNSVYFALPNTNIDIASGGRVTATSNTARQIQFGLNYTF
jgi:hypothetical protein